VYYEPPNRTITVEYHQQQLINLNRVLNQKHSIIEKRKRKVILLHENAWPFVTKVVKDMLSA